MAGKAAAAALQNTVYQLLSETFSNEYQFGFRYIRKRFLKIFVYNCIKAIQRTVDPVGWYPGKDRS